MSERARAEIHPAALRHNLTVVRRLAPGRRVYAAVKADAYGHGVARLAGALADADGLAVASLAELRTLRAAGLTQPVVLLSDVLDGDLSALTADPDAEPLLFSTAQFDRLAAIAAEHPRRVWIKLDTGMHRLGFAPDQAASLYQRVRATAGLTLAGWMTHLGCADDPEDSSTERQVACFDGALAGLPGSRSIANSAGICAWPATHADLVRPGIMLYGGSPLLDRSAADLGLKPVMTLTAPLISLTEIAAGEPVGYGATWRAPETMPVGVVAIGYGDGYPRHAPSGTPASLNGAPAPLVGRVSMDMITVDLRRAPDARVGDRVELWGADVPADAVARAAGTIAYELFCRLSTRVHFGAGQG